jgi:hypothetical protein
VLEKYTRRSCVLQRTLGKEVILPNVNSGHSAYVKVVGWHNNSYRHFQRPLLFSAAYTRPPKISPYFRRLFKAAENSLIFGGCVRRRRKYGYNNGRASLSFTPHARSRSVFRAPPAAVGLLARAPAARERCLRPPPRRPPRRVPPPAVAFPARCRGRRPDRLPLRAVAAPTSPSRARPCPRGSRKRRSSSRSSDAASAARRRHRILPLHRRVTIHRLFFRILFHIFGGLYLIPAEISEYLYIYLFDLCV